MDRVIYSELCRVCTVHGGGSEGALEAGGHAAIQPGPGGEEDKLDRLEHLVVPGDIS